MNMNANMSFPKWIKKRQLSRIKIPVLVLFGEKEFAFSVKKAVCRANLLLEKIEIQIVQGASHLLPLSKPEAVNKKICHFYEVG